MIDRILEFYEKNKIYIYALVALIIIVVSVLFFKTFDFKKPEKLQVSINETEKKEEVIPEEYYYIDIKGEVVNPGVYKLIKGSRVIDVINVSGGLKENANTKYINLSKQVTDEMVVVVYTNEEILSFKEKEIITIPCNCEKITNDSCIENIKKDSEVKIDNEKKLININTATKEELITLTGIGEAKADAIIKYREEKLFEQIEDIKEVSGISDAIFEKIKEFITI